MQPAEKRDALDGTELLRGPKIWHIFVQREMCPDLVVIGSVILENATQVRFVEHDEVVESFAPNRSDEALDVAALPR